MMSEQLIRQLRASREFFDRSTGCLTAEHAGFKPTEDSMTTAQQIKHVAQTVDWFREGAFGEGFTMDFEQHIIDVKKTTSIDEARESLTGAYDRLIELIGSKSDEELASRLPEGPIMGGAPRSAIVGAIDDHTAHHRGVLTVHSRLLGLTPAMPYM